jgi:hypothetical protein
MMGIMPVHTHRTSTPLTDRERADLVTFATDGTREHDELQSLTDDLPRHGSEAAALRALAVLGMRCVRDRLAEDQAAEQGYVELARQRADDADEIAVSTLRRQNMTRLAATDRG